MKTLTEGTLPQCTYNYDVNGNRSSIVYTNGMKTDYTYNLANMLKTLVNYTNSTTVASSYGYTYRLDGNQTAKADNKGKTTTYIYDDLGRLTKESDTTGFSLTYVYDVRNNRTKMTANDGKVTDYTYDLNNLLLTSVETLGTTSTKTTYFYDANGNTLSKMNEITAAATGQTAANYLSEMSDFVEMFTYDLMNRMISSTANGVTAIYKYRPDGLRHSKTANGVETAHIWDGANIVSDIVNGALLNTYVRGIGLIASKSDHVSTYYFFNGHGDVVQFGNILYDYDAFGNERNPSDGDTNPFRYCGMYYDLETKIYMTQYRRYNSATGRFLTEDPYWKKNYRNIYNNGSPSIFAIMQIANLYVYCGNNPVLRTDTSGLAWKWAEKIGARVNLNITARLQYPWLFLANISVSTSLIIQARISFSINSVENNRTLINSAGSMYGVPTQLIGAIIFKEQLTQSLPDLLANVDTFFRDTPHSTGLGAIFPKTARGAWNLIDPSMVNGISDKDLQYMLSYNDSFNIQTIAAVLIYEACRLELISDPSEAKNLTLAQWQQAVAAYNGSDEYARKVYEYLDDIETLLG